MEEDKQVIVAMAREIAALKRELTTAKSAQGALVRRTREKLEVLEYIRNFNPELVADAEKAMQGCGPQGGSNE